MYLLTIVMMNRQRPGTGELRALGVPTRHLGPVHDSRRTLFGVAQRVVTVVDHGSILSHLFLAIMTGSLCPARDYYFRSRSSSSLTHRIQFGSARAKVSES
jgi:hypothetical protein